MVPYPNPQVHPLDPDLRFGFKWKALGMHSEVVQVNEGLPAITEAPVSPSKWSNCGPLFVETNWYQASAFSFPVHETPGEISLSWGPVI